MMRRTGILTHVIKVGTHYLIIMSDSVSITHTVVSTSVDVSDTLVFLEVLLSESNVCGLVRRLKCSLY